MADRGIRPGVTPPPPPAVFALLAHPVRWQVLRALAASDLRVQELVTVTRQPANLVSYHLKQLRDDSIVSQRRSDADARDIYYTLNLPYLRTLYAAAGQALHPLLGATTEPPLVAELTRRRVLFICTHNSARSQMAEAWLRYLTGGQVAVFSAGSQPAGVHALTISTLSALGIDISQQHSTPLDSYYEDTFDDVITVCDRAREVCPTFPGPARYHHWSIPDPLVAPVAEQPAVFAATAHMIELRVRHFLAAQAANS